VSYAIDFGTSNTAIARWNAATNQPELVHLPELSGRVGQVTELIPSLVYVEDTSVPTLQIGQQVRDRGLDSRNDSRFFQGFKRGIGATVQGFLPELDGHTLSFEQIGQWYLAHLLQGLQSLHPDARESLVLTVPVDSFETYRHWLGKVCADLEIDQVRMLDEPTAAALGYGQAGQDLILVVDFGGGTLDLSLVQLQTGAAQASQPLGFLLKWGEKSFAEQSGQRVKTARVLAKSGQTLGGTDLDQWIVDYFAKTQGATPSPVTNRLAERLKIQLSLQPEATEVFFDPESFDSYDWSLTRLQFEQILQDHQFFERLDTCMTQVLQQAQHQGVQASDVNAVLFVGGSSQIPALHPWITQYFPAEKVHSHRPFDAIATGALQVVQGLEVKDFLYHSYGVRYWDRKLGAHSWHRIIPSGQPYPMTNPIELVLGASTDGQPSIELIIGELGSEVGGTEVFFDGDRLVTRTLQANQSAVQVLNDRDGARAIAQLNPPGFPGSDRIRVLFQVDEGRSLRITVEDLLTQENLVANQLVATLS
jgi:molecular chaperone DnaK (HSP70)